MSIPKKIEGFSAIDHRIRIALKITNDEYVMADLIYQFNRRHSVGYVSYAKYYSTIGFLPEQIISTGSSLKLKGIIDRDAKKNRYITTASWNIHFDEDVQFAKLWSINNRGTKQLAKENFLKMRKMIGFNALVIKLQEYMDSVSDPKYVLKLQKWLDPKYKRWEDEIEYKGGSQLNSLHDDSIPYNLF